MRQIPVVNVQELKKRLTDGFRTFAIRTTDGQEDVPIYIRRGLPLN